MDGLSGDARISSSPPRAKARIGNALVLIAPADIAARPARHRCALDWAKLLGGGRLAVGDPDHVPAGDLRQAGVAESGRVGARLSPICARAEDVRAALVFVERGEAPLGIVYLTDARADAKVKIVGVFPSDSHTPIVYPFALLKGADHARARLFPLPDGPRRHCDLRALRLYGEIAMLPLSAAEIEALLLSLRVSACGDCLRAAVCAGAPRCGSPMRAFPAKRSSKARSHCRWCCRRWWWVICCCWRWARAGRSARGCSPISESVLPLAGRVRHWPPASSHFRSSSAPSGWRSKRWIAACAKPRETLGARAADRFLNLTLPLALPGIVAGAITAFAASLGEFGAIITFRLQHSRRNAHACRLRSTARCKRRAARSKRRGFPILSIVLALVGVALGRVRPAPRQQIDRAMSVEVALASRFRRFRAGCAIPRRAQGRHGSVRPVGRGQDQHRQCHCRIAEAARGPHRHRRPRRARYRYGMSLCPPMRGASAMCFRMRGCFRI